MMHGRAMVTPDHRPSYGMGIDLLRHDICEIDEQEVGKLVAVIGDEVSYGSCQWWQPHISMNISCSVIAALIT